MDTVHVGILNVLAYPIRASVDSKFGERVLAEGEGKFSLLEISIVFQIEPGNVPQPVLVGTRKLSVSSFIFSRTD